MFDLFPYLGHFIQDRDSVLLVSFVLKHSSTGP